MKHDHLRKLTGILLVSIPVAFTVFFTLLGTMFDYPDILRASTDQVMRRFQAGGSGLIVTWYGMTLTAASFIVLVLLVHQLSASEDTPYMPIATTFGVVAGVVQVLGFIRWPFLVPYLARVYLDPASSEAAREAVAIVFQAFNQYAGVAVGEHLGYLFTSLWTGLTALAMLKSPLFKAWLAWPGVVLAAGIFTGLLEPAGVAWAGPINAISYLLWAAWLVAIGFALLRADPATWKISPARRAC